jgi:hypothetical protein
MKLLGFVLGLISLACSASLHPLTTDEFDGTLTRNVLTSWIDNIDKLDGLTLNNKGIKSIEPDTFAGLDRLRMLNMFSNQLTSLQPRAFAGLLNLALLNLGEFTVFSKSSKDFVRTTFKCV